MCKLKNLSLKEINEMAVRLKDEGDPDLMIAFNRDLVKMQAIRPGFYRNPVLPNEEDGVDTYSRVLIDFVENDSLPVGSLGL
ncbi:hypothetical protein [Roseibium album]|uniref:hypothetical protein n=1 Tax=Roseibium album TaxID=311410 RepID=UPI00391AE436